MIKRIYVADCHGSYPELAEEFKYHEVMLLGDMVEDGSQVQYAKFSRWLKSLDPRNRRVMMVPGNHDLGNAGLFYNPMAEKRFWETEPIGGIWEKPNTGVVSWYKISEGNKYHDVVIGLDSCLKTKSPHDFAQGMVNVDEMETSIAWFKNTQTPRQLRTVCLHHDPFSTDTTLLLKNAGDFVAKTINDVHYVFYGHTHISRYFESNICKYYSCPAVMGGGPTWEQVLNDDGTVTVRKVTLREYTPREITPTPPKPIITPKPITTPKPPKAKKPPKAPKMPQEAERPPKWYVSAVRENKRSGGRINEARLVRYKRSTSV